MPTPISRVYRPGNRIPVKMFTHDHFKIDGVYCKLIPSSRGLWSIVWESDYEWLSQRNWFAARCEENRSFYARTNVRGEDGKQRGVMMHRMILGLGPYKEDRRDGDHKEPSMTLDNRRSNLRAGTHRQNSHNRRPNRGTKAALKGVNWHERDKIYEASIRINGKLKYLGRDVDPLKCHHLYCAAARQEFGEFARTA